MQFARLATASGRTDNFNDEPPARAANFDAAPLEAGSYLYCPAARYPNTKFHGSARGGTMDALVYPRERTLGTITLVLGLIAWVVIVLGTLGIVLIYLLLGFIAYLFAQSALIAHIKNTAVRLTPQQFPDLHARFLDCCKKLQIDTPPEAYVLAGNGLLNAFATRFLGRHFVVLLSDTIDALEADPEGINFYIGHELGHVRMKHLTGRFWRMPVLWLPLIGAAYSRAKES